MIYRILYGDKEFEFDSDKKSGEIDDLICGSKRTVPVFIVDDVLKSIKSDKEISKKVDDALLETSFAGGKAEKGIKRLEDRVETKDKVEKKRTSKKYSTKEEEPEFGLSFVELKILGRNGDPKSGFNPGQWRAVGVLDPNSKGVAKDGSESFGAIYLFEEVIGRKDSKSDETADMIEKVKMLYRGDVKKPKKATKAFCVEELLKKKGLEKF